MAKLNVLKLKQLIKDEATEIHDLGIYWDDVASEVSDEFELTDWIAERISEESITYYVDAMKYLTENDPSLRVSVGLAVEAGFDLKEINSEDLATLLFQDTFRDELNSLDFTECFDEDVDEKGDNHE